MGLPSKVLWFEGLALAPQQFQQQDLYHEARLQRTAAAINPHLWGLRSVEWDATALLDNSLQASAMSLMFQDGEIYEASASEQLPAPVDLSMLPIGMQQFTFYAALPRLNIYGDNLSPAGMQSGARYGQHDLETSDLYSDAIATPVVYLRKNVRLLSEFESRDAYVNFPVVRIKRKASGGFQIDPTFFPPSMATGSADGLQDMLEKLLTQLYVKIETLYGRHRQSSKDVFEIHNVDITSYLMLNTISTAGASLAHSLRYRFHHPEFVFDKLSTLAGGLLAFSRRYGIGGFPAYHHEDAAPAFYKLDAIIRDLLDVTLSSRYRTIALVKDTRHSARYEAVLDPAITGEQFMLGLAISADIPALELVAMVPVRCKISAPENIDDIVKLALPGVKLNHMAQVPAAVPVQPNTHYFSLESKGSLYETMLKAQAMRLDAPSELPGLKIELFSLAT